MTFQQLKLKIATASPLDFGDILSESFELYKKVWLQGLLYLVISMLAVGAIMFVAYIPMIAGVFILDSGGGIEASSSAPFWIVLLMIVFYLFIICGTAIFSFALKAAFFRKVHLMDTNLESENGWSWGMFLRGEYLKKTIFLSLATVGISIVATMLCFFPLLYVMVPLQLVPVLYAFNKDLSVSDIISLAFDFGNKKWLLMFGLILIAGFLSGLGVILCYIGVLFTAAFAYMPAYLLYKQVIGVSEIDDAIETIGQ